jgi:integrase
MKINLTKAAVDALPNPEKGQVFYYDTKLPGFGVYTMKTCKTYFAEARVGGKTVRTSIGRHGIFFPDRARDEAREILVKMSKGENPNGHAKTTQTLKGILDVYLKERTSGQGRKIKDKTLKGYQWLRDTPLKEWHATPQEAMTQDWVRKIHGKVTMDNGPVCANNAFRMLRAAFNYLDIDPNPVDILSRKRLWNPEKRRSRFLESEHVSAWIKAAESLNPVMRGLVLMMLFTGMRKMEVLTLQKSQIRNNSVYLDDTKNNDDHMVPMGPYLLERINPLMKLPGKWLFPGDSKAGHVMDPRKSIASLGQTVSAHDLRRTFVSHLNALEPAPSAYTIKRLMNHRQSVDVTAGYIQLEEKKLREVITQLERAMVGNSLNRPGRS